MTFTSCLSTVPSFTAIPDYAILLPITTAIGLTAVMKDSLSLTSGDMTGLTFCGARTFSITSPATIPTWLAIDASTGSITLNPTDPTLGGTIVTVTIQG